MTKIRLLLVILALLLPTATPSLFAAAIIADHTTVAKFNQIPVSYFSQIRADYSFFYGHTSHGSQIMPGWACWKRETPRYTRYQPSVNTEVTLVATVTPIG